MSYIGAINESVLEGIGITKNIVDFSVYDTNPM